MAFLLADSSGVTGFRREELRSVYAVIYTRPGFQNPADTMRQFGPGTPTTDFRGLTIYASPNQNQFHFSVYAQPGTPFSYRVFVPTTGKIFNIDNVSHTFSEAEGSCKCQYVAEKRFTVNGQLQVQPIGDGKNNPVVVLPR
ncbi:hypothetical protein [Hymenobacter lapidiphilus]|uniref:hypothetical protein n=1 Tax=Hymenobacter sp. CCM 8763 TaxID=2303334 RepID=UPI0011C0F963|nr:hypothetical protein [Hymenobacter sp. CCM 8763]